MSRFDGVVDGREAIGIALSGEPSVLTTNAEIKANALATALKAAADAHHEYEKNLGHPDEDWPTWYAHYIVEHAEQI